MLGIADIDYQRSDRLQDALEQYGIVSFVVNTTNDHGSRSLIMAADTLIVTVSLLGEVLLNRHEHDPESGERADVVVPFVFFAGCSYQVVMRTSGSNWRPDWRLFRARLSLEPWPSFCSAMAQYSKLKIAS